LNAAPFWHAGGALLSDHGPIGLTQARTLIRFYGREALDLAAAGDMATASMCARRALRLHAAMKLAERWRRAGGWADPDAADRVTR